MSDMIHLFINYQKAVMSPLTFMQCHTRILCIMPFDILAQLLRYLRCVNIYKHSWPAL